MVDMLMYLGRKERRSCLRVTCAYRLYFALTISSLPRQMTRWRRAPAHTPFPTTGDPSAFLDPSKDTSLSIARVWRPSATHSILKSSRSSSGTTTSTEHTPSRTCRDPVFEALLSLFLFFYLVPRDSHELSFWICHQLESIELKRHTTTISLARHSPFIHRHRHLVSVQVDVLVC
jgi:hypothetical protein